jgi:DNA-binding NarL/FixJ family response regulator
MSVPLQFLFLAPALALAAAAATYFTLLRKFRAAESISANALQNVALNIQKLEKEIKAYRERLEEAEQRHVPVPDHLAAPASIHLNRRGQVAQLHRRGETVPSIAVALGISQGEVKLLIKLHDLNRSGSEIERQNLNLKSSRILDNASGVNEGAA